MHPIPTCFHHGDTCGGGNQGCIARESETIWSAEFDKGSGGEINGGLRGEVANTLTFGRGLSFELVGVGEMRAG